MNPGSLFSLKVNKKTNTDLLVNYSAYSPDLPGCISTGATREDAERNMHEAIEMHARGLLEDNLPIPETTSFAEYVAVN